jgi:hypothetical protein
LGRDKGNIRIRSGHSNTLLNVSRFVEGKRGIIVLHPEKVTTDSVIQLKCDAGHLWSTKVTNLLYTKTWCKKCFDINIRGKSTRLSVQQVVEAFKQVGLTLAGAVVYSGNDNPVLVQHTCGHTFRYSVHRAKTDFSNSRPSCPKCSGLLARYKLNSQESASEYAQLKGGVLVSWAGKAATRSVWKCSNGHEWLAAWKTVHRDQSWCSKCRVRFGLGPRIAERVPELTRRASKTLSGYSRYDKKNGLESDLTLDDILVAKQSKCTYCSRQATGMDRVDNDIGHTKANCVPACVRCNWVRGNYLSHGVMVQVGKLLMEIDP